MSRLFKVIAVLLATLWLPASVHCQLENAGLDTLFACAGETGDTHEGAASCSDDGCRTIETGQVAWSKARVDAGSLALLALACSSHLFEMPAPETARELVAVRQETTLPLQRTWQFDRRAAPPARAPERNAARA